MTKILVENQELDLTADLSHQLTFSIDDIRNLDSKTTAFSKTIVIPGTERNNKIFGNLFELGNANFPEEGGNLYYNFDASKSVSARIEINGLQAMKGVLRMLSITVDKGAIEYEVAIFGELGGFISAVSNKKLEDLDFSDYDHEWSFTNITGSWQEYKTFNIPSTYEFKSPKSSDRYAVVYPLEIDYNVSSIQEGDRIKITGSCGNDGLFTVLEVFYNSALNKTTLHLLEATTNCSDSVITIEVQSPYGYGYVYPLIDYGQSAPTSGFIVNHDFEYTTFRPALFVREYMDRIIKGAGYTWESEFADTTFFRSLIIPNNDKYLEKRGENFYVQGNNDNTYDWSASTSFNFSFPGATLDPSFSIINSDTAFRYDNVNDLNVKATINIVGYLIKPGLSRLTFKIVKKNDGGAFEDLTSFDYNIDPYNQKLNVNLTATTALKTNEEIRLFIQYFHGENCRWVSTGTGVSTLQCTPISEHTFLTIDSCDIVIQQEPEGYIQYQLGDTLKINDTLPKNVLQKDFIISLMKMFNLMVVESRDKTKHLMIEPYVNYYQTTFDSYEDWTMKVNRDKPMIIKPMSEINARVYEFKYKDDSDYYNELYKKHFNIGYGNRDFDNSLEFAKDKQAVELTFSSSVLVGFTGEDKVFPAIYEYSESDGVKTPKAHNIRIMQIKKITDVEEWYILQNNDTAIGSITEYLYAGHLNDPDYPTNDINWGAPKQLFFELVTGSLQYNLFNNFYSPYMAEIIDKDSRLVTCEMKLTEKDIFNLDFSRFKMIDGVLFRLMKIYDWAEGTLCKVDLLRVINTTYLPDTLLTSKTLRMRFTSIAQADTLVGTASSVNNWNTFFNTEFTSCFIDNNDVILIGNTEIKNMTGFQGVEITGMWDNLGCIVNIDPECFKDSLIETFVSHSVESIDYDAFYNTPLIEANIPNCISLGDSTFRTCTDLKYLYLNSLQQCGSTTGDDQVFGGISANTIYLTTNAAVLMLSGGYPSEGDFVSLFDNNTVNLTTV